MNRDKKRPPLFALRLLKWFCKPEYHADIEGDLIESFEENKEAKGIAKAKWLLFNDLLQLFRPGILRSFSPISGLSSTGLWKSNLKSAIRTLIKRKEYSIVNSLGLSLGIASTLLVLLYVQDEFSYDKSIPNADQIFKLVEERKTPEGTTTRRYVPYSFARTIPQDFPDVADATAFSGPYGGQQVWVNNEQGQRLNFLEDNALIADNQFLSVFGLRMLAGDPKNALKEPNSIVLTESTARRLFGETNPLGQFISAAEKKSVVTGICEDPPENSHLKFSYLVSSSSVTWFNQENFTLKYTHLYLRLHPQAKAAQLEAKFPEMVKTHMSAEIERINQLSWEAYQAAGNGFTYKLKPLTSIHLDSADFGGMKAGGSIVTVRIMLAIAVLIFCIACVNFINLATARSTERALEVGVRKVMGSHRTQLVAQFLTESLILSFISLFIALGLVLLALSYFNELTNKQLILNPDIISITGLIVAGILVGLLAGIYPAFALSSFKPIAVLKGNFSTQNKGKWLRNGLVVFQFWIAIILITCTLVIQKQVDFLASKDLGFDKEQLMVIEGTFDRKGNFAKPFLNEIKNLPQVKAAAGTMWLQGFRGTQMEDYETEGSDQELNMASVVLGDGFAEVMGLELIDGALFSQSTTDSSMILLNETALKRLGLDDPIGKKVAMVNQEKGATIKTYYTIKGIVKDFHYQSLHDEIGPLVMLSNELYAERMWVIAARLNTGMTRAGAQAIEEKWQTLLPDLPFNFRFLDQVLDNRYKTERHTSQVFSIFSGLSIFISIIGLFALSAYTVSLRAKEIGIRKVVGASVSTILKLLFKNFSAMVLLAFLLAFPVGWYAMENWLNDFAYRIVLSPLTFILAGGLILIVTWCTVGYQSFKAARINPIRHLKNE
ncbi:MAG: FtsX-like permease family protein [Roseivirga sp.]|nr:FtsX-like permease family protein [Roseivirga sp.]